MKKSFESIIKWNSKSVLFAAIALVFAVIAMMPSQTNAQTNRNLRVVSVATQPGQQVTVSFILDSLGNEASASFTVTFNQLILSNPVAALGNGVPAGTTILTNNSQVGNGRLGVLVATPNSYTAGARQIITITFNVAANAPIGLTPVAFSDTPVGLNVSAAQGGGLLPTNFVPGNVQIGSTAAGVKISGRVLTPDGRGLRNARVTISDENGEKRIATTSSFGYYEFEDVGAGATYVIGVSSKQYRFTSRVLQVTDSLVDFDFVGQE